MGFVGHSRDLWDIGRTWEDIDRTCGTYAGHVRYMGVYGVMGPS